MSEQYDVVVIGGGPGGYVAAIRAGQLGLRTACVEMANLGGVCLNVGCIPSKALIHASKLYWKTRNGSHMGILGANVGIDMGAMIDWKDGIAGKLTSGVGTLLKANGVQHIVGRGRLAGPGKVIVEGAGGPQTLQTRNVILATGSTPVQIPFLPWGEHILDSTGALALRAVPKSLAVVGGGVIGMELGEVFARLGSDVTIIEALPRVLAAFDADLVRPLEQKQAKKLGMKHWVDTKVTGAKVDGDGVLLATSGKVSGEARYDKVLVAVGRRPNSANLGLETVGLQPDARGFVAVDDQQRTGAPGIYAIGDLAGNPMLAHKASKEGEVAAEVIAGHAAAMDAIIPSVVYTDPEIATVGPTLEELRASGRPLKIGKFGFGALGRAMTADATDGFARVIGDADTGEVLAIHLVGAEASELVAEAGLALEMSADLDDLALTVHSHPTMAEAVMEAAKAALGEAIHAVNR